MVKRKSIQLKVYTLDEACERLAVLAKHKKPRYSLGGLYKIIGMYKPELLEPVVTEEDLEFLAGKIRKPGRPKIVDKID